MPLADTGRREWGCFPFKKKNLIKKTQSILAKVSNPSRFTDTDRGKAGSQHAESQLEATRGPWARDWGPRWPPEHLWADEGPGDKGGHLLPPGEPALPRGARTTTHGDHRAGPHAFSGMLYLLSHHGKSTSRHSKRSEEREAGRGDRRACCPATPEATRLWGRGRRRVLPARLALPSRPPQARRSAAAPGLGHGCSSAAQRVGSEGGRERRPAPEGTALLSCCHAGTAHASRGPPTFRP